MTQPVDVIKTRAMNARPGEFKVSVMSNYKVKGFRVYLFPFFNIRIKDLA